MAVRKVPGAYATVQEAVNSAVPGDMILIAASYDGDETVSVTFDNLIFSAPANVTGLELKLQNDGMKVTLAGMAPIEVSGGDSDDVITGNLGDNIISDSDFSFDYDQISGGGGADRIFTYSGFDKLNGDAGDDYFGLYGEGGTVDGGAGIDTVAFYQLKDYTFKNVEVLDTAGNSSVWAKVSQLASFSTIINSKAASSDSRFTFDLSGKGGVIDFSTRVGGAHSVEVSGEGLESAVKLSGTANADVLSGFGFHDTLDGGAGADTIKDSSGGDVLKGGAGNDAIALQGVYILDYATGLIDGGDGIDTVLAVGGSLMDYSLTNVEVLDADYVHGTVKQFASFNTVIDSVHDEFDTGRFGAILDGSGGAIDFSTRLRDGRSLDLDASDVTSGVTVIGTAKNDLFEGSKYRDIFKGAAGSDVFVVQNTTDFVLEAANGGKDTVQTTVSYKLAGKQAVEVLTTTDAAGKSTIALTGNEIANAITGNAGANTLDGGLGRDVLTGLGGKDTFLFKTALGSTNVDRIVGFVAKDDRVQLDDGVFKALDKGKLSASEFKDITSSSTKLDADDHILYNHKTGGLYYDADGSGSAARVQFAILDKHPTIHAGDFFVV